MVVKKQEATPEQKANEEKTVESQKLAATNAVLASLDLPADEAEEKKSAGEKKAAEVEAPKKEEKKEETKQEKKEEKGAEADISDEELLETADEELTEEGLARKKELQEDPSKVVKKEEELIPKSKVNKILKKMEKRIELANTRAKKAESKSTETKDPVMTKLEKLSQSELREAKRRCRKAQLKAQMRIESEDRDEIEKGEAQLEEMLELEEKIDAVANQAPLRFQKAQITAYNEKVEELEQDEEIEDFEEAFPKIKEMAKKVFLEKPSLQRLEDGQALALEYAADHYKLMQKAGHGKKQTRYLKQAVSKLKKKTNLDSRGLAGKPQVSQKLKALRQKAFRGGDLTDKQEFVKEHPVFGVEELVPDNFK